MPGAIDLLRNALSGINPNGFTNPDGTCFLCAIETADVLMTGRAANPVNAGPDNLNYNISEDLDL